MKKIVQNSNDHLVVHDVASVVVAGALGLAGTLVTGSPETGLLASSVVAASGIGGMRIGPIRRSVNTVVMGMQNDESEAGKS